MARIPLLIACLCAALARPAATFDAAVRDSLTRAWAADLAALESTREHAAFLKERGVPIRIVYPAERRMAAGQFAEHDRGAVYVSGLLVDSAAGSLEYQDVPRGRVAAVLSRRTVQIVAHELRHAMNAAAVERRAGMAFRGALIEDEASAYLDQAKVRAEASRRWPDSDFYYLPGISEQDEELAKAVRAGTAELERKVAEIHGVRSLREFTDEALAAHFARRRAELEEAIRATGSAGDAYAEAALEKARAVDEFLSSPRRIAILRDYYLYLTPQP
ncbi:MAG: hypothetical protein HY059_10235 [Proteobacteria bacterium]|nr:hypothetical protein [Pseudomonadota bacterium]